MSVGALAVGHSEAGRRVSRLRQKKGQKSRLILVPKPDPCPGKDGAVADLTSEVGSHPLLLSDSARKGEV